MDLRVNSTSQDYDSYGAFGPYASIFPTKKMSQVSPYVSLVYKTKKGFTLEAGTRINIHSAYGSNAGFSLNPSYLIKEKIKIFANFYSAFKTPTLYQLYESSFGNNALKPETGLITEAGIEMINSNGITARVVGFYRDTKNKIDFIITDPVFYISQYQNISKQTNYGGEFEFAYHTAALNLAANYTYTDGSTTSRYDGTGFPMNKDTTYFNLYRVPRHTINLRAGYDFSKKYYLSVHARQVSRRFEFIYGASPEVLKSYFTADIHGQYMFGSNTFFIDIKNVLNKQYFDIAGYNSKRMNVLAGFSFHL
jgi:vitamin B12 transporter